MTPTLMKGRVLVVAGSDSGGGAGIQADIKTITALAGFATTAITAITAQNSLGVQGVFPLPPALVAQQIASVLDDLGTDVIKIGMLHSADLILAVIKALEAGGDVPWVVDPVMVAKGGAALLETDAIATLRTHLLPRVTLLTPNIPEAEALTGLPIRTVLEQQAAGKALLDLGAKAVLLKGGHGEGEEITDLLLTREGEQYQFTSPRIATRNTHGTGCTLASAVATGLAQNLPLPQAVARAHAYVFAAIGSAPHYGAGHGPLNHAHTVRPS